MAIQNTGGYQIDSESVSSIGAVHHHLTKTEEDEVTTIAFSVTVPGGTASPVFTGENAEKDAAQARAALVAELDSSTTYDCHSEVLLVLDQIVALSPVGVVGAESILIGGKEDPLAYGFTVMLHGASTVLAYTSKDAANEAYSHLLDAWKQSQG